MNGDRSRVHFRWHGQERYRLIDGFTVRSPGYTRCRPTMEVSVSQPPAGGYPPPDPQPGGYPPPPEPGPPAGGYPPPAPGYTPPPSYSPPPSYPPPGGYQPPPPGFAPPPAAPGGYPPPAGSYPPPAGYAPPGGASYPSPTGGRGAASFNASAVGTSDWIIIGSGLVLLIFSFFGWLSSSYSGFGLSVSTSWGAWHEYWWLATVLGVAVSAVVGLRATMGQSISQVKPQFLMFAAAAGFVITLISLIEIFAKGDSGAGFSIGPGIGVWICLIVSAAQTYFVWLWAQKQPGWSLPKLPGPSL